MEIDANRNCFARTKRIGVGSKLHSAHGLIGLKADDSSPGWLFSTALGLIGGIAKKQMGRGWGGVWAGRGGAMNKCAEPLCEQLYGFPYLLLVLCRRGDRALHDWKFKQRASFSLPFFVVVVAVSFLCVPPASLGWLFVAG